MYWWYSNESCASMTKVKNPSWCCRHPDGSYSFSVAVDCPVWAISPDANPRITGSTWCGDCRRLAGCHVTFNGTGVSGINAGSGSGTRTTDRGAGRSGKRVRRYSKRFAAGAQKKTAAIFDLYSHLLSDTGLRRELFAEVDKGSVAEWAVKTVIEKFAEQFAALSDNYLKERAGDLRALGQRLLFHLDDANQGPNAWPERFILVADELSATTLAELPRIA
ncbi:phosphoenolpyruvate-utilizing N-terminal domain-containing protein [Escherichia coli]